MTAKAPRPKIPPSLQREVCYESAYACAICQKHTIQLHHIDQNSSNNVKDNLIALCQEHHGEAHTERKLTVSLTAQRLKDIKKRWESEVVARRKDMVTVSYQAQSAGNFLGSGVSWGYINHRRVAGLLTPQLISEVDQSDYNLCLSLGLVDKRGIIIPELPKSQSATYLRSTIYDRFTFGNDHRVHSLYSGFVDVISRAANLVHVDSHSWSKSWIKQFISPGQFVYMNRGCYFRGIEASDDNCIRGVRTFKNSISFEWIVETYDMFGTSSISVSFSGHKSCAAIVFVKSVDYSDGVKIDCSPIAMGTGYWPLKYLYKLAESESATSPALAG